METFDVVNEKDEVIGSATQAETYAKHLTHRIAHIFILNNKGEILLQKRGETCSYLPGYWSTSVGGHVRAGESYFDGACREAKEELGIEVIGLGLLGKDWYEVVPGFNKFLTTFTSRHPGPYINLPGKVSESTFFSINTIKTMIDDGEKIHPELLFLLKKYFFEQFK